MYDGKTPRVTGPVQPVHCALLCRTGKPGPIKPTTHTKKRISTLKIPTARSEKAKEKGKSILFSIFIPFYRESYATHTQILRYVRHYRAPYTVLQSPFH